MKRNIIIGILSFVLIASVSFEVTYSYLIDSAAAANRFVVGENSIVVEEEFNPPKELEPGISFDKKPKVTNTGNLPCFVRMRADFSDSEAQAICEPLDINTADWLYDSSDGYYYYNKVLQPGESTSPLFTKVTIRDDLDESDMKEFDILIYAESIQRGERLASEYKTAWN